MADLLILALVKTPSRKHEEAAAQRLHFPIEMTLLQIHDLLCREVHVPP
jgi:hypothetical protein